MPTLRHQQRPRSPIARHRRRAESGETLIELMVTVVLLGGVIVALLTSLFIVIVSSSSSKRRAQAGNEGTTVVETIERAAYIPCASLTSYAPALTTVPTPGFTPTITKVQKLQSAAAASSSFADACPGAGDQGLQRITVKLTSTRGSTVTQEVTVVKRNDACPTSVTTVPGDAC